MTMTHSETIQRLAQIGLKPSTTMRDSLTIARLVLRRCCAIREEAHAIRHALRRKANQLRRHLPFTKQQVEDLELIASDYDAERLARVRTILLTYGQSLIHDRDGYMTALGFDAVCDLLNVNPVEREQARADGVEDLAGLLFIHNLEDSASHRGEDCKRGPLFEACFLAVAEFIQTAPPGTLPDPFAPGAPFGPKLPPVLRIVEK
ncbi:hypothetical protein [Geopseudomonas aromaticivorans]